MELKDTLIMNGQNEISENNFHLQLHQKRTKYLGIDLTKEVKDLYTENCDIDERSWDSSKWKVIPCSWIARINIVKKCPYYPKQSTDSILYLTKSMVFSPVYF